MNATRRAPARVIDRLRRATHHRSPGQMLVMVALCLVSLFAILGLTVDLGVDMVGRRAMQNAADAGALAGARIVALAATEPDLSALAEVQSIASDNRFLGAAPTIVACSYVDDAEHQVGDCSSLVPATATGVSVAVRETHPTFFMPEVFGRPSTSSTAAGAAAHVQLMARQPADGPFLVCGVDSTLASGGSLSILVQSGGSWVLNPAAADQTFVVHGPQANQCGAQSSRFKGIADQTGNLGRSVPSWFGYTTGDVAGQISATVEGIQGCQAGQPVVNCVALLPVAVNSPPETDNSGTLWTVAIMPFYITQPASNVHYGRLIANYPVLSSGGPGWTPGYSGPTVIRITQ